MDMMLCFPRKGRVRLMLILLSLVAMCLVVLYRNSGVPQLSGRHDDRSSTAFFYHRSSGRTHYIDDQDRILISHTKSEVSKQPLVLKTSNSNSCALVPPLTKVDINVTQVYSTLNFYPSQRSYWNQTFENRYLRRRKEWANLPLKVIVLPHTHPDPGWLKTYDEYYVTSVSYILNNMVNKLNEYKDLTFIWAEISYFSYWWDRLKNQPQLQKMVKDLIDNGQLEIVTGGWVMTDEAAAHYYAMIDQLIEGHQWLQTTLGVVPSNAWSIDPFGHSSTLPYLLKLAGMKNMFIQRTHFAWKQYLAEKKQLEFWWKQNFNSFSQNQFHDKDILCHMSPFDLYSIKHSCGPHQRVCLMFDFRRIPGEISEITAEEINKQNVQKQANLLVGQYGRLGSLFPHNVALVLVGDDFRYNHEVEWDQQYKNYKKLFNFINANKDYNVDIKFGTLGDYFQEVHKRMRNLNNDKIPTLLGDFFPYGDVYADGKPSYWTGYFTTRPMWKKFCRDLESWLRSAEILYSLAKAVVIQQGNAQFLELMHQNYEHLTFARQALGLFQHHDAITGTSKQRVMHDYGQKLFKGFQGTKDVIATTAQFLLFQNMTINQSVDDQQMSKIPNLVPDDKRLYYDSLPEKNVLLVSTSEGQKIVLFNSFPFHRHEVVHVLVKNPHVRVVNSSNKEVLSQVNPIWNNSAEISDKVYQLNFLADLLPLSLSTFTVLNREESTDKKSEPSVSVFVNDALGSSFQDTLFNFQVFRNENIVLKSPYLSATFSKYTGLLKSLHLLSQDITTQIETKFLYYNSEEFHSGAYLFQPNPISPILNISDTFPIVRLIQGHLMSELTTTYPNTVTTTFRVYHLDGLLGAGMEIETKFDLYKRRQYNLELFMRLESNLASEDIFYTDSNGFQMTQRIRHGHIPLEANFYPVSTAAYIEDTQARLTLLTSNAHGCTSSQSGNLEVVLDRRLAFDDNRGLGEGVLDNKPTNAHFWLLLEERQRITPDREIPNLSVLGHALSSILIYPAIIMTSEGSEKHFKRKFLSFVQTPFPCDVHLVNLRTLPTVDNFNKPSNSSLLILHRQGHTCHVRSHVPGYCAHYPSKVRLSELSHVQVESIYKTSLTGIHMLQKILQVTDIQIQPMEVHTYNITFI
ncbi:alpha-mannosidase 2-like isoform X1 [Tachypleus tridentatus]|uniref:alpha-mannosidase 2-like isoform X1 n=3 Tax=Tachypleus tridentatus TaxID=6853 RepID=UPI003FD1D005